MKKILLVISLIFLKSAFSQGIGATEESLKSHFTKYGDTWKQGIINNGKTKFLQVDDRTLESTTYYYFPSIKFNVT